MQIEVTAAHIADGKRRDCYSCPAALAIRQALGADRVVVGYGHITVFMTPTDERVYVTPAKVERFMEKFDGLAVKTPRPFSFDLGEALR